METEMDTLTDTQTDGQSHGNSEGNMDEHTNRWTESQKLKTYTVRSPNKVLSLLDVQGDNFKMGRTENQILKGV